MQSLFAKDNLAHRHQSKWQLIRGLYDRGLDAEQVHQLYRLIDGLLELPRELQQQLKIDLNKLEEERRMPYITSTERLAREEGREKGLIEGRDKGFLEGQLEELHEGLSLALELKFGEAGRSLADELRLLNDLALLKAVQKALRSAATVDDLRALLK